MTQLSNVKPVSGPENSLSKATVAGLANRSKTGSIQLGRSGRSRIGKALGVQILATGSYVPPEVVTNENLSALGCDSDWIVRRTGILERRKAGENQATSDLAFAAAERALENANLSADQVDLILVATITPDHPTPSTACHLQRRLGSIAPAMDLNAACGGFMYGLVTASQFIVAGSSTCALVVGADLMSRTIDPTDNKTYPLFGDAAGAAVLVPDQRASGSDQASDQASGLLAFTLGSEGCGGEMLCIPAGGTRQALSPEAWREGGQYLRMDGRAVFKWAVRTVAESSFDLLAATGMRPSDLDLIILHQANQRIIDSAVSDLGVDPSKVFVNLEKYGNTSAASIPLALDEAIAAGRVHRGDNVLLCGFGAGLAWGTALVRY
jgi:3-oxoacyl-[acyl-carrier-protein] synthase-3